MRAPCARIRTRTQVVLGRAALRVRIRAARARIACQKRRIPAAAWTTGHYRRTVGSIQLSHVGWRLPGGRDLLRDVSFTVGDGDRAALVGANGVGKSTLMRLVAGEISATSGTLSIDGRLGVMRQLVGVADA